MIECHDAERLWNRLLDAGAWPPEGLEAALEAHASSCDACARVAARYRTVRRALSASDGPPEPSPEFLARVIEAAGRPWIVEPARPWPRAWLSAAAILLVGLIGWRFAPRGGPGPGLVQRPPAPIASPETTLAEAFADAASSTFELARETSAPAGRVGRAVFASASGSLPRADAPEPDVGVSVLPTSRVLQAVGGRVGAGVRPLSGSARNAFGFLLRDAPEAPKGPTPTPRGA